MPNKPPKQVHEKENRSVRASKYLTTLQNDVAQVLPATVTPAAPAPISRSGTAPDVEKARRRVKHEQAYKAFLASAEQRRIARKDLESRNRIWQDSKNNAHNRLEAIDRERQSILQKLDSMRAAKDSYAARYTPQVSGERDEATRRAWEAYFNLEVDVLEV